MSKTLNLADLLSVRTIEKIIDNFSEATELGCIVRDLNGKAITKACNPTKLWQEVVKHPHIEKEYHTVLLQTLEKCTKTGQIEIYNRYLDTYAFSVPIYIEGRITAFFVGGLARFGNPDMELCAAEAKKLNIDLDAFLEMYLMLPIITQEKLEACANLLRIVGSTISTLAKEGTEAKEKLNELREIQDFLEKKINKSAGQLHVSEERYRNLFNTINDGVYVTDANGILEEINEQGAKMLGYDDPNDLIGTNLRNVYVNPEDRDEFTRILFWQGHIEHFHPHVKLKNGGTTYFETNSTAIKDKNGKIVGVQGIFRTIGKKHQYNIQNEFKKNESVTTALKKAKNNQKTSKTARRVRR